METGAQVLATSCPYCISNFEESALSLGDEAPRVMDVTEVILEAMEGTAGGDPAEAPAAVLPEAEAEAGAPDGNGGTE